MNARTQGSLEAPGMDGEAFVICTNKGRGKRRTVAHAYTAADAALFAAAPDALAASKSTVERLSDLPTFLRNNGYGVIASIVDEELAAHRAVIARAEG